jgi:outer membrane protein TolC
MSVRSPRLRVLRAVCLGPALSGALALAPPGSLAAAPPAAALRLLAQVPPAAAPPAPVEQPLALREGILLALQRNLDLVVERYNPRLRGADLTGEIAAFDPSLFFELKGSQSRIPDASGTTQAGADRGPGNPLRILGTESEDANVGLRERLPTGGTIELRYNNQRAVSGAFNNQPEQGGINPAYRSDVVLSITQPLLKNFGLDVNTTRIRIARNNLGISLHLLRNRAIDVVTQVQNAYWDLVFARQNLEVQRRSLRLAEELVALNRAREQAGVAAPVEVTQAETDAAARLQDVLVAEKQLRDAEDELRRLLNAPREEWSRRLAPTEQPAFAPVPVDPEAALREALDKRPDYRGAKADIENRDLNQRLQKNQLLPDLSLVASAGAVGLADSIKRDLSRLNSLDFNTYAAGLTLTIPLGNRAAQSAYARARLEAEQARTAVRNLELTILTQVRETSRRLETDAKRIESTRAARRLAEEQLRVEQVRLEAGVTTTFNVLRLQRDLTAAEANEIKALTDYNKSLAAFDRARGTTLDTHRIDL